MFDLVISYWLSMIDFGFNYRLTIIAYRLSVIGNVLSFIVYRLSNFDLGFDSVAQAKATVLVALCFGFCFCSVSRHDHVLIIVIHEYTAYIHIHTSYHMVRIILWIDHESLFLNICIFAPAVVVVTLGNICPHFAALSTVVCR